MTLKKHQPPMGIEEQIENLKSKNLIIENESEAHKFLNDVSYFRLIKAYSLGLKDKNANYRDQASFDLIKELYLFNSNFRHLLFPQIEKVEINLRCRFGKYFSLKYGVLGYLDSNNFVDIDRHSDFIKDAIREISYNNKAPFIKNFQQNYDGAQVPFYALLEVISFGTLSKLFRNLKPEDKKEISSMFGVRYRYFESWIESIAYVRNVCAHYGRLYNAKLSKTPELYDEYKKKGIHNYHIFSIILCVKHLLETDEHWSAFINDLNALFNKYSHVRIDLMGFPVGWKDLLSK